MIGTDEKTIKKKELNMKSYTKKGVMTVVILMAFVFINTDACAKPGVTKGKKRLTENTLSWNFDHVPAGKLPKGWKVGATNQKGHMATWKVIQDKTAPSGNHVLALTSIHHRSAGTFNLCWTNSVFFLNGEITVRFKAVKGKGDQGGGVIWRAQDENNYYIARFNPLEDNFIIYYVRNGVRRMLTDTRITLPAGKWLTLKIIQRGNRFEGFLNGKMLLEGKNNVFKKAGGVGLWTKADAVTSFDDFSVRIFK